MNKKYLKGSVKKSADGIYLITASTSAIDRQGDSVDQAGWDLTNFKQNPVLLWAHDYSSLPIGKVVDIGVVNGELQAQFVFASEEANPKAAQVQRLYEEGFVNASSVGFIAKERNGHVITRSELLELSLVPVPANQEALRLMVESKSFDADIVAAVEKGAVTTEVGLREAYDMKWDNWENLGNIIGAFWSVYFDEATPVDDFSKLLKETITLLDKLANGDTVNEEDKSVEKAISPENTAKFIEEYSIKSGKKLSKKTLEKIDASIEAAKEVVQVLENLKIENDQADSTSTVAESGDESNKKVDPGEEVVVLSVQDFVKTVQSHVRTSDKANEQANLLINSFLARKK